MPIYLDHNATTPIDPAVLEAMQPYLGGLYGNASSLHRFGRMARDAIEAARAQVADLIGAQASEVIWTSGASESDNLAIKGGVRGPSRGKVLIASTEHPAVLESAQSLSSAGYEVQLIGVDHQGLIEWPAFETQLAAGPVQLVAVMAANNETGVIQDCARVARALYASGAVLLVDAVQAAGKIDFDFKASGADMIAVSAHKLYGPAGVGALIKRADQSLEPIQHGGGQEKGLRGGTQNVAGIVGFGAAAQQAAEALQWRSAHLRGLRDRLEAGLHSIGGVTIFAESAPRLPNTTQFALPGWEGEALLMALDRKGIAVSSGSACASGRGEPSHVLIGMGIPRELAFGAVRVSFGIGNTEADVQRLLSSLAELKPAVSA